MTTISSSDRIFATVLNCGGIITRITLEGMTSFEEIVKAIRVRIAGLATGFVTLILRNGSQGWSIKRLMRAGLPEAVQLSLF